MNQEQYPFPYKPLPYLYDALEPHIDTETLHYHHDKHYQTYVTKLNEILQPHTQFHDKTLPWLLSHLTDLPQDLQDPVKNNGGGVYNHELYFESLTGETKEPGQQLSQAVADSFGSFGDLLSRMKTAGLGQFGSGYAWLVVNEAGKLEVISLPNQNSPLSIRLQPLLGADVWEHAYYLKYQNRRADYLESWTKIINWEKIEERYQAAKS